MKRCLLSICLLGLFVSCSNNQTQSGSEARGAATDDNYRAALEQQMKDLNSMETKADQARETARADELERERNLMKSWLQGTWEYSGYDPIAGQMSVRLIIDGDYARLYGNGKLMDSGHLEIGPEEGRIFFGQYTGLDIDMARQIIYTGDRSEGTYMHKSTGSVSSGSSYSGRGSNGNTSRGNTFATSSDVMAYVGNKFKNSAGNVIRVKSYGIICDGTQITNGVRVVRFNGSQATLSATSPYAQGTQHFYVDASRGTITDGTGDVFYIQ